MGSGISAVVQVEEDKPLSAVDVSMSREDAIAEVQRLRTLLLAQHDEFIRGGEVTDDQTTEDMAHEQMITYEKALLELFMAADEDGDALLRIEEFRHVMQRADLGLSDEAILKLMKSLDDNDDGVVTWREFFPLALNLVDGMEALSHAQRASVEKKSWADQAAMELEVLYADSFEAALAEVSAALAQLPSNDGTGIVPREDFLRCLEAFAPPPIRRTGVPHREVGAALQSRRVDTGTSSAPPTTASTSAELETDEPGTSEMHPTITFETSSSSSSSSSPPETLAYSRESPHWEHHLRMNEIRRVAKRIAVAEPATPGSTAHHLLDSQGPMVDTAQFGSAALDERFLHLKRELLSATGSALERYLFEAFKKRAAAAAAERAAAVQTAARKFLRGAGKKMLGLRNNRKATGAMSGGNGSSGGGGGDDDNDDDAAVDTKMLLTPGQMRNLFAADNRLPLTPLQILTIVKSAPLLPASDPRVREILQGESDISSSQERRRRMNNGASAGQAGDAAAVVDRTKHTKNRRTENSSSGGDADIAKSSSKMYVVAEGKAKGSEQDDEVKEEGSAGEHLPSTAPPKRTPSSSSATRALPDIPPVPPPTLQYIDCAEFAPLVAAQIEAFFDPAFLARRSTILQRGPLCPVDLLRGRERAEVEARLARLFDRADGDGDGFLSKREFHKCVSKLNLGLEARDIESLRAAFAPFTISPPPSAAEQAANRGLDDKILDATAFMTFAFSSLLHLLRERALHDEEVVDHGDAGHGLGGGGGVGRSAGGGDVNGVGKREGVGNAGSLASNPGALLLQGRVQLLVAKKRVRDAVRHYETLAGPRLLEEIAAKRRALESDPAASAQQRNAIEVFTERARAFNEACEHQLSVARKQPDLPWPSTVLPD